MQRGFNRAQTAVFNFSDFFKLALMKIPIHKYLPMPVGQYFCKLQNCIEMRLAFNLI